MTTAQELFESPERQRRTTVDSPERPQGALGKSKLNSSPKPAKGD